jgi:hypothetical protein
MILTGKLILTPGNPRNTLDISNPYFSGKLRNIVIGPDLVDLLVPEILIAHDVVHTGVDGMDTIPLNAWALSHMTLNNDFSVAHRLKITLDASGAFRNAQRDPLIVLVYANLVGASVETLQRRRSPIHGPRRYLILKEMQSRYGIDLDMDDEDFPDYK